jgi:predicted lipoprotein with Yx(FWY)xxD motif
VHVLALVLIASALGGAPAVRDATSTVTVQPSRYGRVLFDGRGYVLYAFTKDARGKSNCYGECASRWPPFLVRRAAGAGKGARASLLGTTKRRNGTLQVTYAGRPLYYYVGDTSPGLILCQNAPEFGGIWLVVRADGSPVR